MREELTTELAVTIELNTLTVNTLSLMVTSTCLVRFVHIYSIYVSRFPCPMLCRMNDGGGFCAVNVITGKLTISGITLSLQT